MTRLSSLSMLLAVVAAALGQHGHPAGDPPPPLTLEAATVRAAGGQEVELPVTVKGAAGIGPMQFVLTYDPTILEAIAVERGPLLGSNTLLEFYADPSGRLAVAWATRDAFSGDGVLVKPRFRVTGKDGQKTILGLEQARGWDAKTHLDALVTTRPGEFTVAGAGWPWWWFAIAGGVILLLVLIGLARRQRSARG